MRKIDSAMRKLIVLLFLACFLCATPSQSQNRAFPNAVYAKLNFLDYGALHDGDLKLSEGFEVGYFRNIAPYLNIGVPLKVGLAKLPLTEGNTVTTSFDLVFQLQNADSEKRLLPYAFGGGGYFLEDFSNGHLQFPFGGGVNYKISTYAYINGQIEFRKALEDNRDNLQLGLGFMYLLHRAEPKPTLPPDTDKDGTPDAIDKCPTLAGPAPTQGCPDRDNDGVTDADDQCPNDPGTPAAKGCPDYDNDGVPDNTDECPTEAGMLNGCPDQDNDGVADKVDDCPTMPGRFNGCPDTDGDGVPDKDDNCPSRPGPASNNGCPLEKDRDGDGVADDRDRCPDKAGTFDGCPDTDGDGVGDHLDKCPNTAGPASSYGCPEIKQEVRERLAYAMRAVQFETGKATLLRSSYPVLDELVEIMRQYPDYKMVISGHTDNVGDDDRNLKLSEARAQTCFDYLVFRGVQASRMRFAGYGETRPMADNSTNAGRELNRRVEFELKVE